jgi:hypothetical protein
MMRQVCLTCLARTKAAVYLPAEVTWYLRIELNRPNKLLPAGAS